LGDERFTKNIKNACFEIGNSAYNDELNRFLHNPSLTPEEVSKTVMSMQRNIFPALWEKSNYSYYLKGVWDTNAKLPDENKINIYGLDMPVFWQTATKDDIHTLSLTHTERDSLMADNFIRYYKQSETSKALVVLNYRHAFLRDFVRKNAGMFINNEFKGKVANVYINSFVLKMKVTDTDVPSTAILAAQNGKWDAAFMKTGKKDVGFDFAGTPFGKDSLDMVPISNSFTYSDVFTGFIYYNYFPDLRVVGGLENFVDDEFTTELKRRMQLQQEYEKVVYNSESTMEMMLKKNNVYENIYRNELPDAIKEIEQWLK
jgi:hypothetical protein